MEEYRDRVTIKYIYDRINESEKYKQLFSKNVLKHNNSLFEEIKKQYPKYTYDYINTILKQIHIIYKKGRNTYFDNIGINI